jgi:predicted DsbA family dithiol-disulfide isomerase
MVRIDIVSDFVCPWCYIGKRNVDALRRRADIETRWHPYLLHPDLPPGGIGRAELMRAKFGDETRARELGLAVEDAANAAGLYLRLDAIEHIPDTRDAHRVMRWAAGQGVADALAERLFAAHFVDGRDIGDHDVLAALAGDSGLDTALVRELLAGDADRNAVQAEADRARAGGISGVPTVIAAGNPADQQEIAAWMRTNGSVAGRWFFVDQTQAASS